MKMKKAPQTKQAPAKVKLCIEVTPAFAFPDLINLAGHAQEEISESLGDLMPSGV